MKLSVGLLVLAVTGQLSDIELEKLSPQALAKYNEAAKSGEDSSEFKAYMKYIKEQRIIAEEKLTEYRQKLILKNSKAGAVHMGTSAGFILVTAAILF